MTNMHIWDQVSKTDPKHTKDFKRAGGFSGTAIKPMYAIQKMTETFGACGKGWGYTKPEYQIVDGTDGQKLVYCTVGLWHSPQNGIKFTGQDDGMVWGVGGDFIIVKQSAGLRSDDEAFKKAFTDALMNAMKHIGMSADVHMGQFDGSKYDKPVTSTLMTDERKAFIIKIMVEAKDSEVLSKIQADAKSECEKLGDLEAYKYIIKQVTEQRTKAKEQSNVVSK